MNKNAEGLTGDLATDFAALRQDVARLTETIGTLVQRQTQVAGDHVSGAVQDARETISGAATSAQRHLATASGKIETSIEQNPLTALLVALGIGLSLGMLSRSRSS